MPEAPEVPAASPLEMEMRTLVDKFITPQVNRARATAEEVATIQKDLLSKMERGTNPADTTVQDLEAEKAERDAELNAVREDIRSIRLQLKADVGAPEREPAFRGVLFRDIRKLQDAIRHHGTLDNAMQARAIDTTDIATAGKMSPDLESQFLSWLIQKQVTLNRVTTRRMTSSSARLDEIIVGNRKLAAGVEATAPSLTDAVTFAKRDLNSKEVVWAEDISKSFLEDNIEQEGAEATITQGLATAFGNDSNDLFWNGDEGSSVDFIALNDGIIDIAKADAGVVDFDATSITTAQAVLAGALRALPSDYALRPGLSFFVPYKTALTYADEIADRVSVMGDAALVNGISQAFYFGLPVIGEPHLNLGSSDEGVLTLASNLVWGVQRGITLESQWSPRKRAVEVTISARTDQNYAKSQAVVLIDNIESTLR